MKKKLFAALAVLAVAVASGFVLVAPVDATSQEECYKSGYGYDSSTQACYHKDKSLDASSSAQEQTNFTNSCSSKKSVTVGSKLYCVVLGSGGTSSASVSSSDADAATTGGEGITQTGDRGAAGEGTGNNKCGGVNTSIIDCDDSAENGAGIFGILLQVLNVLTFGIGIAGTLGIVIAGIMYLTARDSEAQLTKAKNMLINIVIGLAAYAVMWAFLQWLIPGGLIG